jgi:peptidoglycan/LPS O-acetylase OafA/YrhL
MDMTMPDAWIVVPAFALWWLLLSYKPFLVILDVGDEKRLVPLDGLRGILSILVFAHHFALTLQFDRTGAWTQTSSTVWNLFGQAGVTLFFMITGFLFFGKIRRSGGYIPMREFFAGRIRRLMPAYCVVVAAAASIALARLDFMPLVSGKEVLEEMVMWATFSPSTLFGLEGANLILAGVMWTLKYEWIFYACLPVLAWCWRRTGMGLAFPLILAIGTLVVSEHVSVFVFKGRWDVSTVFLAPFVLGGLASLVPDDSVWRRRARGPGGLFVTVGAVVMFFGTQSSAYAPIPYLMLFVVFMTIALGNDLMGLLSSIPVRILGAMSYGIYLRHGLVLYVLFRMLYPGILTTGSLAAKAMLLTAAGMMVVAFSVLLYACVEKPIMRRRGPRLATV